MGKKVKVVTACGEIHHYEYNQEVETVEIVDTAVAFQKRFNDALTMLAGDCPRPATCGLCAFQIIDKGGCAKLVARHILEEATGYNEKS